MSTIIIERLAKMVTQNVKKNFSFPKIMFKCLLRLQLKIFNKNVLAVHAPGDLCFVSKKCEITFCLHFAWSTINQFDPLNGHPSA